MEVLVRPLPWVIAKATSVDALCHGADLSVKGIHMLDPDIRRNALAAVLTIKGELIGLGTMQMSSDRIMASDAGVAVKMARILMEPGHYPRMWHSPTDLEGLGPEVSR